jgi:NAD(P)H-dependent FMN reductase
MKLARENVDHLIRAAEALIVTIDLSTDCMDGKIHSREEIDESIDDLKQAISQCKTALVVTPIKSREEAAQ